MFIDEWFDKDYYKKLPLGYHTQANFAFGQFFFTHAYYAHENLELWRPVVDPNEPTKTIASNFRLVAAGKDAFRRSLPLHAPKLETNEEFLVVRAKRRPVLLIQPDYGRGQPWLQGKGSAKAVPCRADFWAGGCADGPTRVFPLIHRAGQEDGIPPASFLAQGRRGAGC